MSDVERTCGRPDVATYELMGLAVRSEAALEVRESERDPDIDVVMGPSQPVPDAPPEGEMLSVLDLGGLHNWVTFCEGSFTSRFPGIMDAILSRRLDRIELRCDPDATYGLPRLLVEGTLLAQVLALRGSLVLHASALEIDGRAIAFVGHSGAGKSTLAAWCCAALDAAFLADDALRVEAPEDGAVLAYRGTVTARLRAGSASLAQAFPGSQPSADGRTLVRPPAASSSVLPLAAIVLPSYEPGSTPTVRRLRAVDALFELQRYPRTAGWIDGAVLRRQLAVSAAIVERVPVSAATLPPGPPFDERTVRDLIGKIV